YYSSSQFFLRPTSPPEIYTLSLHDALPIFDHSVLVGTSNGTVIRVNASDGSVQWETQLLAQPLFSGITSSPKVAFDRVFIGTFKDRKSTRLNSSHDQISYAVFCLKKKNADL